MTKRVFTRFVYFSYMYKTTALVITTIILTSCGNNSYTCSCKDGEKEVANYKIETAKKESASFECKQKSLAFSGNPEFEKVECVLD